MKSSYSPAYGTATGAATSSPHLAALAELLSRLTEHEPFVWSHSFPVGAAGHVTLTLDLDPCELSRFDRDVILSVAARFTNMSGGAG